MPFVFIVDMNLFCQVTLHSPNPSKRMCFKCKMVGSYPIIFHQLFPSHYSCFYCSNELH
jgi:hypothetical protein